MISISIVSYAILPRDQFQVGSITGLKIDKDLSFLQIRSKPLPTPTYVERPYYNFVCKVKLYTKVCSNQKNIAQSTHRFYMKV